MNIPAAALDELICDGCYNLLAGVTYTFPEKRISLCNNCTDKTYGGKFREIAYEAIAANFLFPCTNASNGCWKKFQPSELREHEYFCPFTMRSCIECEWSGFESRLIEHFTDAHASKLLHNNTPKQLKYGSDYSPKYLLLTEAQIFEVNIVLENRFLNIAVSFPYKSPKQTTHRVNISCNNSPKKTFVIENNSVRRYSKIIVETEVFDFKISVLNAETVIPIPPLENHYLLNTLICSICKSYMSGKIYFCKNSHNCCEGCKKEPCFCCEGFDTRNHSLESLAEEGLYPCRYPECVQILPAWEREAHELTCEFSVRDCPLCSCKIKLSTFQNHLVRKHRLYVKRGEDVQFYFTEATEVNCFYLHRVNGYFKLTHKYSRKMFYFSVQYWGNPVCAGKYAFCIKMKSKTGEEFVAEQRCVPFTPRERAFDDCNGFISVPSSVLKPFISSKMLAYRVYVYEACEF